jgi:3-hydroxyisobutyrate dehydrogenase-like beta-hydroxyacid dehydrogenase
VEGREFVELLTNSLFGGVAYTVYGQEIVDQSYRPPGFTMALGLKDLGLAESVAAEAGVTLPVAPVLRQLFETALADPELRDADWGALAEVTRRGLATG